MAKTHSPYAPMIELVRPGSAGRMPEQLAKRGEQQDATGTAERRRRGTPAATATARSNARNDWQHFGSLPTMLTACSDHRPVTSQWCSFERSAAHLGRPAISGSAWCGPGFQEQLLIDLASLALCCDGEQLGAQLEEGAADVFGSGRGSGTSQPAVDVKSLHAKIGELTLENDFLEGALGKAGLLSAKR
jgi:transposase